MMKWIADKALTALAWAVAKAANLADRWGNRR